MNKTLTILLLLAALRISAQGLPPEETLQYSLWYNSDAQPMAKLFISAQQTGKTDYQIAASIKAEPAAVSENRVQAYLGVTMDPSRNMTPKTAYETVINNKNWRTTEYLYSDSYVDAKTFKDKDAKRTDTRFMYPNKPRDILSAIWLMRWHNYSRNQPAIPGGVLSGNETEDVTIKQPKFKTLYINGVKTEVIEITATRQKGTKLTILFVNDENRTPVSFSLETPGQTILGLLLAPNYANPKEKSLIEEYGLQPKLTHVIIEP